MLRFLAAADAIGLIVAIVVIVFMILVFIVSRIKKCPSDKILVVYGKVGSNADGSSKSAACVHGGAKFVYPFIQAYQYVVYTIYKWMSNSLKEKTGKIAN